MSEITSALGGGNNEQFQDDFDERLLQQAYALVAGFQNDPTLSKSGAEDSTTSSAYSGSTSQSSAFASASKHFLKQQQGSTLPSGSVRLGAKSLPDVQISVARSYGEWFRPEVSDVDSSNRLDAPEARFDGLFHPTPERKVKLALSVAGLGVGTNAGQLPTSFTAHDLAKMLELAQARSSSSSTTFDATSGNQDASASSSSSSDHRSEESELLMHVSGLLAALDKHASDVSVTPPNSHPLPKPIVAVGIGSNSGSSNVFNTQNNPPVSTKVQSHLAATPSSSSSKLAGMGLRIDDDGGSSHASGISHDAFDDDSINTTRRYVSKYVTNPFGAVGVHAAAAHNTPHGSAKLLPVELPKECYISLAGTGSSTSEASDRQLVPAWSQGDHSDLRVRFSSDVKTINKSSFSASSTSVPPPPVKQQVIFRRPQSAVASAEALVARNESHSLLPTASTAQDASLAIAPPFSALLHTHDAPPSAAAAAAAALLPLQSCKGALGWRWISTDAFKDHILLEFISVGGPLALALRDVWQAIARRRLTALPVDSLVALVLSFTIHWYASQKLSRAVSEIQSQQQAVHEAAIKASAVASVNVSEVIRRRASAASLAASLPEGIDTSSLAADLASSTPFTSSTSISSVPSSVRQLPPAVPTAAMWVRELRTRTGLTPLLRLAALFFPRFLHKVMTPYADPPSRSSSSSTRGSMSATSMALETIAQSEEAACPLDCPPLHPLSTLPAIFDFLALGAMRASMTSMTSIPPQLKASTDPSSSSSDTQATASTPASSALLSVPLTSSLVGFTEGHSQRVCAMHHEHLLLTKRLDEFCDAIALINHGENIALTTASSSLSSSPSRHSATQSPHSSSSSSSSSYPSYGMSPQHNSMSRAMTATQIRASLIQSPATSRAVTLNRPLTSSVRSSSSSSFTSSSSSLQRSHTARTGPRAVPAPSKFNYSSSLFAPDGLRPSTVASSIAAAVAHGASNSARAVTAGAGVGVGAQAASQLSSTKAFLSSFGFNGAAASASPSTNSAAAAASATLSSDSSAIGTTALLLSARFAQGECMTVAEIVAVVKADPSLCILDADLDSYCNNNNSRHTQQLAKEQRNNDLIETWRVPPVGMLTVPEKKQSASSSSSSPSSSSNTNILFNYGGSDGLVVADSAGLTAPGVWSYSQARATKRAQAKAAKAAEKEKESQEKLSKEASKKTEDAHASLANSFGFDRLPSTPLLPSSSLSGRKHISSSTSTSVSTPSTATAAVGPSSGGAAPACEDSFTPASQLVSKLFGTRQGFWAHFQRALTRASLAVGASTTGAFKSASSFSSTASSSLSLSLSPRPQQYHTSTAAAAAGVAAEDVDPSTISLVPTPALIRQAMREAERERAAEDAEFLTRVLVYLLADTHAESRDWIAKLLSAPAAAAAAAEGAAAANGINPDGSRRVSSFSAAMEALAAVGLGDDASSSSSSSSSSASPSASSSALVRKGPVTRTSMVDALAYHLDEMEQQRLESLIGTHPVVSKVQSLVRPRPLLAEKDHLDGVPTLEEIIAKAASAQEENDDDDQSQDDDANDVFPRGRGRKLIDEEEGEGEGDGDLDHMQDDAIDDLLITAADAEADEDEDEDDHRHDGQYDDAGEEASYDNGVLLDGDDAGIVADQLAAVAENADDDEEG